MTQNSAIRIEEFESDETPKMPRYSLPVKNNEQRTLNNSKVRTIKLTNG